MKGPRMAVWQQGATKASCNKQEVNNCMFWIMQAVSASCDSGWVWHNPVHIDTYMYTQVYIYITYACGGLDMNVNTMKIEEVMACVK